MQNTRLLRRALTAAAAGVVAFGATTAVAENQQPSASDIANARALGVEGVELADKGDCTTAIDRLWRAESLYHAPTILGRLGECQVALGKLVLGTETLQRVVREPIGPKSPPAFVAARDRAQKVLDATLPKIPKILIHVENSQIPNLVVKVDGEAVPLAGLDVDRPTDPGFHKVEASAPGYATASTVVTVGEGGRGQASLKLEPAQPAATAAPVAATAPPSPAPGPAAAPAPAWSAGPAPTPGADEATPSRVGPIVLLAVGGAGLIVGGVFGGLALGKKSSLDSACHPKSACPASSQGDIDGLNTDATVATIGFAAGGVALVAGGIWFLAGGRSKPKPAAKAARLVVHPYVGPLSAGVSGVF